MVNHLSTGCFYQKNPGCGGPEPPGAGALPPCDLPFLGAGACGAGACGEAEENVGSGALWRSCTEL